MGVIWYWCLGISIERAGFEHVTSHEMQMEWILLGSLRKQTVLQGAKDDYYAFGVLVIGMVTLFQRQDVQYLNIFITEKNYCSNVQYNEENKTIKFFNKRSATILVLFTFV